MEKIPATAGLQWIEQGFTIFRKQPAELATLFFFYLFMMFAVSIIPAVGTLIWLILIPALSLAFLQACVHVLENKRVYPTLLLTGFRSPAFGMLVVLGILHVAAFASAVGAASLIDGGMLWKIMTGQVKTDPAAFEKAVNPKAMLTALLVCIPWAMALWYATPLAAWKNMSAGKAIFYSFFATLKARKAFIFYLLGWFFITVIEQILLGVFGSLFGETVKALLEMTLLSLTTVIFHCSFYCSYVAIFQKPDAPAQLSAPGEDGGGAS